MSGAGAHIDPLQLKDPSCGRMMRDDAGGYKEVLRLALPLVLSTASMTLSLFMNRLFLSWYGRAAVAAATPGGITYFTICCFFMGAAQYVNTIVAQHYGAGDSRACARAMWQGVVFSLLSTPLIAAVIPLGRLALAWGDHGETLVKLEQDYFTALMFGGVMLPLNAALSSFFSGRGETKVVMWGNVAGSLVNGILDYCLIFGRFGFPELGIVGAGIATAVSGLVPAVYWLSVIFSAHYRRCWGTVMEMRWDRRLFMMLLRFGVPSGVQVFLDVASFALFVLLVGRLGEFSLAVTNIVLAIEMLSFLPMIGMSIATATLVGEHIGAGRTDIAEKSAYSALRLAMGYMAAMSVLFFVFPQTFIEFFRAGNEAPHEFERIIDEGTAILRIVALYNLFDTMFIVFSGALKGSGDTKFAMWAQLLLAWFFFVPPVYVLIAYFRADLLIVWVWAFVYIAVLGTLFFMRFRSGYWKNIGMLELG
ncbi:MAG: MATE family efflux transporter [Pseudomonadota bacterium]